MVTSCFQERRFAKLSSAKFLRARLARRVGLSYNLLRGVVYKYRRYLQVSG